MKMRILRQRLSYCSPMEDSKQYPQAKRMPSDNQMRQHGYSFLCLFITSLCSRCLLLL